VLVKSVVITKQDKGLNPAKLSPMINLEDEQEFPEYARPNKSQLKREAHALQVLAKQLAAMHESVWPSFNLSRLMLDELMELKNISQHVAKKRQLKRVAKLLRDEDVSAAQDLVANDNKQHTDANVTFHKVEQWRDKLISEDRSAVTEFLDLYSNVDLQLLNQLVRHAKQENIQGKQHKYSKLLFKHLREIIAS